MKEDNTVFVLQQAIRRFKIKVSDTSIKEFLLAHPYYPSLKSVCDALRKYGIEHYPLMLETAEIRELELPFVAHLSISGGQLVFVKEIKSGEVRYLSRKGKSQLESFEKFAEKLSGAVVLIETGQKSKELNYKQNRQSEIMGKALLPLGILTVVLFALFNFFANQGSVIQSGFIFWGLLLTKPVGIAASVFLILHELKIHSPLGSKICSFSSKTDCDEVLASNASHLFGWFNWADAGLIYFIGTFIYLVGSAGNSALGVLAVISILSLPYPVFSIYYQSMKLKKWCPFCMIVQLVLVTEFFLLFPTFKAKDIFTVDILRLFVSLSIPAALWLVFKAYNQKNNHSESEHYSFLQFKRNPEVLRSLLTNNDYAGPMEHENSLILGSPDAPVTVTAFLSLYCNPCAKAFKQLKSLLDNCPEVKINIVFSVYGDEETQKAVNTLYYLYATKGTEVAVDFLNRWYSLPKESRKILYSGVIIPEQHLIALQIGDKNKQLFDQQQVAGTPTIYVNGYKFPIQYEYSDLEYYAEDIRKLTMKSKSQEACAN